MIMPNMNDPYAYIEEEILRLRSDEMLSHQESERKRLEAEIYMKNRMKLESALDKQKEADKQKI